MLRINNIQLGRRWVQVGPTRFEVGPTHLASNHILVNPSQPNVLSDFHNPIVYIGGVGKTERRNTHEKTSDHNLVGERLCRRFL